MSGEVISYICNGSRAKFLTHKNNISKTVLDHLGLDKENYIVKLIHDDDDERLQKEHTERIERAREKGKNVLDFGLPGIYSFEAILQFKNQRDKNRYYEDGSIVRAFIEEFNLKKIWNELKD
jgi:hypothetical protein